MVAGLGACSSQRELVSSDPGGAVAPAGTGGSGAGGAPGGAADHVGVDRGVGGASSVPPADASPPPPAVDANPPVTGDVCADLVAQYRAGVELGRRCDPRSTVPQCTRAVIDSLDCACPIFIEDTSAPTQARLAWDQVPCPLPAGWFACNATCPPRVPAQCLSLADGTGRCTETRP